MTVFAYLRVSTEDQTVESQKLGIVEYATRQGLTIDKYITDDGVSGTVLAKDRNLNKILKQAKEGDKVIVSELSRLGRSTADVINTCQIFIKKGVSCYFIKQNMALDNTPMGKMMVAILSAFAEMERDLISQRTIEGLRRAKAQGKVLGRKVGSGGFSKLDDKEEEIRKLIERGYNKNQLAKKFKVSFCCVQKFLSNKNIFIINNPNLSEEQKEEIKEELGLNKKRKYKRIKTIPDNVKTTITKTSNSIKLSW